MAEPVRIANCSGFYGDRLSAAEEMVSGGPIDVLTGDWLAELTMLILARNRQRDPERGYARTFVTQMERVMGDCLERGIKVVSNAGGLAPGACAAAVRSVAGRLGLSPSIAVVEGDDLMPRIGELRAAGVDFPHMETGQPLGDHPVITANAYLGGWGIADALARGADIVVTGRVTDASLAVGPAAWWHGWAADDWDAVAGAVVAGHVIECGAQATGGNYAFFGEIPDLVRPGFPIAEIAGDGSSVITKHPGHAGAVTIGTVTAQLLYEIAGVEYVNPDGTARFDTIRLSPAGPDRVRISGVRGGPPPATTKVALNYEGGWKTTLTLLVAGLDVEAKAALARAGILDALPGGPEAWADVEFDLVRSDHADPAGNAEAMAQLRVTVRGDERRVGRGFGAAITELALSSYPGMCSLGATTGAYGVYWPALVPSSLVWQDVEVGGEHVVVDPVGGAGAAGGETRGAGGAGGVTRGAGGAGGGSVPQVDAGGPGGAGGAGGAGGGVTGPARRVPLGRVAGARSGDKGGNANLGVWVRTDDAYAWLAGWLTESRLQSLLPETAGLAVTRALLPNLRAMNFVIAGLLGEGVAASSRIDPQAKSLGEYLRAKVVEIPGSLLE